MLDLYETFYKLTADPFRLSPDHRFVLDHRSYAKSKSYLEYALHRGEGFIVITGGAGTGKTTLINEILAQLDKTRIQVATLSSTQLESRDLLHMVAASFGLPLKEMDKAALLLGLEEFLKQQGQKRRRAVLIVDEAQGLSSGALEELRLLANLQFNNRLLLQVFLIGQEPLRELIGTPGMDHLRQRIVAASHLEPLKPNETVDYVEHRLSRVGWQGDPKIDAEALKLIHSFSGGIPRRINLICSRLFLYGAMEKKHALVGVDAKNVIEDLQQEHLMAPVAELEKNGTTGALSRIGVPAEEFASASVHSLPRQKKTTENSFTASQHSSPGWRSEKPATDSAQQINARSTEPEYPEDEGDSNYSRQPSFSGKDIWGEIEALKQELRDGLEHLEESGAHDDVTVRIAKEPVANGTQPTETVTPASGETEETDYPSVTPGSVESMMAVEPRHRRRARADKGRRRSKRTVATVILALLLVIGFVLVFVVGTDGIDRTVATMSKKIIGEQKGAIQRKSPDTEKPVDQALQPTTESVSEPPPVSDIPEQVTPREETVALDAEADNSRVEAAPEQAEPDLSASEEPLIADAANATTEVETKAAPLRSDVEANPPIISPAPGLTSGTATAGISRSPSLARTEESEATPNASVEAQFSSPKQTEKVTPSHVPPAPVADKVAEEAKEVAPSSIEAQRAGLRVEAEQRLNQHLSARRPTVEKTGKVEPPAAQAPVAVKPEVPAPLKPPKKVLPSRPKLSAQKPKPAPTMVATAPRSKPSPSISSPNRIKSALMAGHWTSRGKPATLLPSEITHCQNKGVQVVCWSVPQNISTQYGLAMYKVEATLQDFSAAGDFRLSYRTLVSLVGGDSPGTVENTTGAGVGSNRWQVTEHSMTCQLIQLSKILCQDEKGTKREYRRL